MTMLYYLYSEISENIMIQIFKKDKKKKKMKKKTFFLLLIFRKVSILECVNQASSISF